MRYWIAIACLCIWPRCERAKRYENMPGPCDGVAAAMTERRSGKIVRRSEGLAGPGVEGDE